MAPRVYLNAVGLACPLGADIAGVRAALLAGRSGLLLTDQYSPGQILPVGAVPDELPPLDDMPVELRSRNNRLARLALRELHAPVRLLRERYGAHRCAVVIGTSTSGIDESVSAVRALHEHGSLPPAFRFAQQEIGSPARFVATELALTGPAYVHSTACASSARALASAARLVAAGIVDFALAGGVDTLSAFTVGGFRALEAVSTSRCNPLSAHRNGINLGEAAAFFIVSREPAAICLAGWGESSDAHHVSAPDPTGAGAAAAMRGALERAGLEARDVDYINLHGTATPQNDAMESAAVAGIFGDAVAVSSTKPLVGHTLGAAGAVEAAFCWLAMQDDNAEGRLPPHLWDGAADPALPALRLVTENMRLARVPRVTLSNSFAFGGANSTLVFARSQ